ncbi:MAG: hypothetical protein IPG50_29360 [Myxococcales bacterium]|nr:hypothetical protein [Myxococcales bacterium]
MAAVTALKSPAQARKSVRAPRAVLGVRLAQKLDAGDVVGLPLVRVFLVHVELALGLHMDLGAALSARHTGT